jgi:hypothetical protein
MQRDIHQAAVSLRPDIGQARDRLRIQHSVADDAKPAGAFGDEYAAIRKKREAPGMLQSFGYDEEPNLVLLGSVEHERSSAQGGHWQTHRLLALG